MATATGSIRTYQRSPEAPSYYYARFSAKGKRQQIALGSSAEGMTDKSARKALDAIMEEVRAGTWQAGGSPLDSVIDQVVGSSEMLSPQELAPLVISEAPDAILHGELERFVAERIRTRFARHRQRSIDHLARGEEPDLTEMPVAPGHTWKRFGDCTLADVRALAEEYESRANDMLGRAVAMRVVERLMAEQNALTVAALNQRALAGAMRAAGKQWRAVPRTQALAKIAAKAAL